VQPAITGKLSGTIVFDYTPPPPGTSSLGVAVNAPPTPAVQGWRATPPGLIHRLRSLRFASLAVLIPTLVLAMMVHHAKRSHAQAWKTTQSPAVTQLAARPPAIADASAVPSAAPLAEGSAQAPAPTTPLATTPAPAQLNLAGTWRGAYVDASGKQLLRVVSLNISRVDDDGGIEGTLRYESASGDGDCKLQPRGSTYSAGEQRLQLSPVGCSPHYPKELGVPLDFNAVTSRASTLKDGRLEAPTGRMIRVRLTRVSGA
jgi:hypothetical protein